MPYSRQVISRLMKHYLGPVLASSRDSSTKSSDSPSSGQAKRESENLAWTEPPSKNFTRPISMPDPSSTTYSRYAICQSNMKCLVTTLTRTDGSEVLIISPELSPEDLQVVRTLLGLEGTPRTLPLGYDISSWQTQDTNYVSLTLSSRRLEI